MATKAPAEVLERLRRSKVHAQKLVSEGPSLQRSVDQVDDASRALLARVSVKSANGEVEATRFLGTLGYNCARLARARASVPPPAPPDELGLELAQADVDGFLRHQRRVILLQAIEEAKGGTLDAARNAATRAMEADWARERAALAGALAAPPLPPGLDASSLWDEASTSAPNGQAQTPLPPVAVPSARDVRLQECVAGWAANRRAGKDGSSVAAVIARSAPDEAGLWRLLAAQEEGSGGGGRVAASIAHLEAQMRAVVLANAGGGLGPGEGGSQELAPLAQQYCASQRHSSPLAVVWTLLRCGARAEAARFAIVRLNDPALGGALERGLPWHPPAVPAPGRPDWSAALACALAGNKLSETAARDCGAYATTEDYMWLRLRCEGHSPGLQAMLRKHSAAFSGRPALQMLLHVLVADYEAALAPALCTPSAPLHADALHAALALRRLDDALPVLAAYVSKLAPSLQADYVLAAGPPLASRLLLASSALLPLLTQAVPDAALRADVLDEAGRALARAGRPAEAARLLEAANRPDDAAAQHAVLLARALARGAGPPDAGALAAARALAQRVSAVAARPLHMVLAACELLQLANSGNASAAIAAADSGPLVALLPGSPAAVQTCLDEADALPSAVALIIPPLYLGYAGALARLHKARPSPSLKTRLQLLVSVAGMLQHNRLTSDVFARLIALST